MMVRQPCVAGGFYPATRQACLAALGSMEVQPPPDDMPERPVAGIVPHAGWSYSGATALSVLRAIAGRRVPQTFVILGFHHRRPVRTGCVFTSGGWQTPLGLAPIDERLARDLVARFPDLFADDPRAHEGEHSLEVQVPLIQYVAPEARIVPVLVPQVADAVRLGQAVGRVIIDLDADAVCLGSSDLTHYGVHYGFTPHGMGEAALRWMRDVNDRRMIDLMLRADAEAIMPEAQAHSNACGPGAVAATLAAARLLGAERGCLVRYTTSADVMHGLTGRAEFDLAVGYAGVVL